MNLVYLLCWTCRKTSIQYTQVPTTHSGRHVVAFLDLFIDTFLEIQNQRYSQKLYLIDYVVPGLHSGVCFQGNGPKTEKQKTWVNNRNAKMLDFLRAGTSRQKTLQSGDLRIVGEDWHNHRGAYTRTWLSLETIQ